MRKILFSASALLTALATIMLTACNKDNAKNLPTEPVPIPLSQAQTDLIKSENTFAFDIFKKVLETAGNQENLMISPLSISTALSMTMNGASGETAEAMLNALRAGGQSPDQINLAYRDLSEALLSVDKRVIINIANSVWTEKDFIVKEEFRKILADYYDAEAGSFDMADPNAVVPINNWIDDKTNGLIKNMIDRLSPNTVMLLVNAIYFKGKWENQFEKSNTVTEDFHKEGGSVSDAAMMKQKHDFSVYDGDGFILGEFPYGQGNFVMDILLPDEGGSTNNLIPLLNDQSFNELLGHLSERETNLVLPRFKYGYKIQLNDILAGMGMGIAFTDLADFSNISDLDLLINRILHQSFIETNEEGTEAAAATVVEVGVTSVLPDPLTFRADHPFIYFIRETSTNSILFMGRVSDPAVN